MTTPAPFRFIRELVWASDAGAAALWQPVGTELGAAAPGARPATVPGTLLLEAMVQCAGLCLARTTPRAEALWVLTGLDDADLGRIGWDIDVRLECTVRTRSDRAAVLDATGAIGDREVCRTTVRMQRVSPS